MSEEEILRSQSVRETRLYERLSGNRVKCGVCERRCDIPEGRVGFCKTRRNIEGKLYTLVYGDVSSISANPIEKKPFFHFWPGSTALTVGTWSCNFTCPWCQNWTLSKSPPNPLKATYISPEKLVRLAREENCQGTSISFNEPTLLFEYSLDLFPLARRNGLYNTYVSNGYMTTDALRLLKEAGMDAIKFDLKGDREAVKKYCAADVDVVWRNVSEARRLGLHVEVVNLVVPGVNDDDECLRGIASRTLEQSGPQTPLHFTRFYPSYKMTNAAPTPVTTLERAHEIAKCEGLRYVYVGNVPGHKWENTYCPNCGELLIERHIFSVLEYEITPDKKCPKCKKEIPIVGKHVDRGC